jgi:hypothetical protein
MKNGFFILILLVAVQNGQAQDFVNLDFEDATVTPTPVNGYGGSVDPAMAFPGWTVGGSDTYVLYNNLTLGSPAIDLMGPNFPNAVGYAPLQGLYSVVIYYDNPSIVPPPTLSQTGLIPANAQSISFLLGFNRGDPAVTLNGVNIPLVSISGGRLAGNISAFTDSIAQLTFSTSNDIQGDNFLYIDDIQFSSLPVPEPSGLALGALGAFLLGFRRWRNS